MQPRDRFGVLQRHLTLARSALRELAAQGLGLLVGFGTRLALLLDLEQCPLVSGCGTPVRGVDRLASLGQIGTEAFLRPLLLGASLVQLPLQFLKPRHGAGVRPSFGLALDAELFRRLVGPGHFPAQLVDRGEGLRGRLFGLRLFVPSPLLVGLEFHADGGEFAARCGGGLAPDLGDRLGGGGGGSSGWSISTRALLRRSSQNLASASAGALIEPLRTYWYSLLAVGVRPYRKNSSAQTSRYSAFVSLNRPRRASMSL